MTEGVKHKPWEENVRPTLLYQATLDLSHANAWCQRGSYTVPDIYTTSNEEYDAIRRHVGIADLSHLVHYRITGFHAFDYVNRLVTRDLGKLAEGTSLVSPFCNADGYVIDIARIEHHAGGVIELYTSDRHLPWLLDSAEGFADVKIRDRTGEEAIIGLFGLGSCATLLLAGAAHVEQLDPNQLGAFDMRGVPVTIARDRTLGELAYHIHVPADQAQDIWSRLLSVGQPLDLKPVGFRAQDVCRIEAGYVDYGRDFIGAHAALYGSRPRTPFELGWAHLVEFGKGYFIGRGALGQKVEKPRTQLVGLDIEGEHVPTKGRVEKKGQLVGTISSAAWSPKLKRIVALATVTPGAAALGTQLTVGIPHTAELEPVHLRRHARVIKRPFYTAPARNARTSGK